MGKNQYHAFTKSYNGLIGSIITDFWVSPPFPPDQKIAANDPRLIKTTALWDTGATNCLISSSIAKNLGLKAISKVTVSHAGGTSDEDVHLVNLYLPNLLAIPFVRVTEASKLTGNFEIIIGMDVLTTGDFSLTNVNGKSMVSFRMPSAKAIDYVKEINASTKKGGKKMRRNDRCYCGSGKQYKHCHGK